MVRPLSNGRSTDGGKAVNVAWDRTSRGMLARVEGLWTYDETVRERAV
jgi:hypothetical protein